MKKLIFGSLALMVSASLSAQQASIWSSNNHWYQVIKVPSGISWENARDRAGLLGGYLATANTAAENDFIKSLLTSDAQLWSVKGIGPWIGGYQNQTNETVSNEGENWLWVSGESFTDTEWQNGQPDNGFMGLDEGYLHYLADDIANVATIGWNDASNSPEKYSPIAFVVEFDDEPANSEMGFWLDVPLSDTQSFEMQCEYRSFANTDNLNYPVAVTPDRLLFDVSTSQKAFGIINSNNKVQYRYVADGDVGGSQWGGWSVHKLQKRCEIN